MRTKTTATESGEGLKVTPIGWEETREILKPLFDDRKHWILVCHIQATELVEEIERRYYLGEKNSDFTLITALWHGQGYALVAARKRWMQPYQLGSLIRQMIKFDIGELQGRDLYVPAPPQFLNDAVALAVYLFDRPALAMAA
jgi:hypothetical protein